MRNNIFLLALMFVVACGGNNDRLEAALELAGDNKVELEKVLEHYSQNEAESLKLQAAVFLIENMPGHYTLEGEELNRLREKFDNNETKTYFSKKFLDIVTPFFLPESGDSRKEDVTSITSDFLIWHIDTAFEQYNNYPWLDDFPFDLFLEYLLPYRFVNERLDYWRDSLYMSDSQVEQIRYFDEEKYLPTIISKYSPFQNMRIHDRDFIKSLFGINISSDCYSLIVQELIKCRAIGIPSSIDFMPYYGNRNSYHYWVTFMSPEMTIPDKEYLIERKAPKIYRMTYSPNKYYNGNKDEYIPDFFLNPFIWDVTDLYTSTVDVTIENLRKLNLNNNYAYLCVFNNLKWQSAAIGEYNRKNLRFDNMAEDLVYLPVAYHRESMIALNYPFILYRDEKIEHLVPDTTATQTITLTRKYPNNWTLNGYMMEADKSFWMASDSQSFAKADTVFTYRASGYTLQAENKHGDEMPAHRYWKFTPRQTPLTLAEFIFIDQNGQRIDVQTDKSFAKLFDGNPLTNVTLESDLVVDLWQDTAVSNVVCIPRTDGNGIFPGNRYELFYYDLNGWQSLGMKIADDNQIKFNDVPSGALLWLHNHTTGLEERIFTLEDGRVRWW